jgi:hypothetical protein
MHQSFLLRLPLLRLVLVIPHVLIVAASSLISTGHFARFPCRPGTWAAAWRKAIVSRVYAKSTMIRCTKVQGREGVVVAVIRNEIEDPEIYE